MSIQIRSEYWITDDGRILGADGENGDRNHEAWVLDQAIHQLFETATDDPVATLLLQQVDPPEAYDGDVTKLRTDLLDASDMLARLSPKYAELYEDFEPCLWRAGVDQELFQVLWGSDYDVRVWGVRKLRWICVKGDQISAFRLTDRLVQRLRDGLWEILEGELGDVRAVPGFSEHQFHLVDVRHGTRYHVSLDSLEPGRLACLHPVERRSADALPGR